MANEENKTSKKRFNINNIDFYYVDEETLNNGTFALNWIQVFGGKKYLIKSLITDKKELTDFVGENKEFQKFEYNALLMPEIVSRIGLDSATYFLAKYNNRNVIITPDFRNGHEIMISGSYIMGGEYNTSMPQIIKTLEDCCFDSDIVNDFIKQSIVNRFIEQTDEKNSNWGVLYDQQNNSFRIAPMFDYEFSGTMPDLRRKRYVGMYDCDLKSICTRFISYPDICELLSSMLELNIEECFDAVYEKHNIEIDEEEKEKYRLLLEKNKKVIEKVLEKHKIYFGKKVLK